MDTGIQGAFSYKPLDSVTVDSSGSILYKVPSYLISALDIRLILLPMYGVVLAIVYAARQNSYFKVR